MEVKSSTNASFHEKESVATLVLMASQVIRSSCYADILSSTLSSLWCVDGGVWLILDFYCRTILPHNGIVTSAVKVCMATATEHGV